MNGRELRSFSHFQIFTWIPYSVLSINLENWLTFKLVFIHSKTMKVSQDDQIRMETWFTSAFLMNGTELRSFRHFEILTKIEYPDLSRIFKLTDFEVCLHSLWSCESPSKWWNWNVEMIYKCFPDEWKRIKKF